MVRRKILWISRHFLWSGQRVLLHSIHGKRCTIEERNFRFESLKHFLDFLEEFYGEYYVYVVVPEKWKETAIEMGYSFGTIHKPIRGKNKNKKHLLFRVQFFGSVLVEKTRKKTLNSKGFRKLSTQRRTNQKAHLHR